MPIDITLFNLLNSLAGKSGFFDSLIIFLSQYFSYIFLVGFIIFALTMVKEKKQLLITAFFSSFFARFVITELIRHFYHRPRPFMIFQVHQLVSENNWSFPSGHSTFFFAMAASVYFYNKKWGILFLIAALLMNISRVIAGVHYPSDILGGMIIGVITAYVSFFLLRKFIR